MKLLGGYEDFKQRTLAKVPGRLGKALFMRQCRSPRGHEHWGMMNAYGEAEGMRILGRIDRETHREVLRAPMDELLYEAEVLGPDWEAAPTLVSPADAEVLGKAGAMHWKLVCETLNAMAAFDDLVA
jgi:hypothetical protein